MTRAPCVVCDRWTTVQSAHHEAVCGQCRDRAPLVSFAPSKPARKPRCVRCGHSHATTQALPWCAAEGRHAR